MAYRPVQGDLVMMDFNPQAGHEQAGRRPALVVSNQAFHRYTRMAIVCPITNQIKDYPMHVKLDERTKTPAKSFVNMSSLSTWPHARRYSSNPCRMTCWKKCWNA